MNIVISSVLIWWAIFVLSVSANAETPTVTQFLDCKECHGIPPGVNGRQKNFNLGAHPLHSQLNCDQCHVEGADRSHVNGVITLKPNIDYSYGSEVPWPAYGGGTCGGNIFAKEMPGCHVEPAARCEWVPGGICRK